ncbi:zinc ribbon domain-containing protein [Lawsonibacter sp. LCP25S3_G6]|uniref:zinc ribbon domain-containing protein n=1 Tax=unclassified Lawsonibacter TaxID=2617946 RepID=UPI003F9A024A
MNESEQKKQGWLPIVGLIALIIVLFVGIKLVFAALGAAIPQEPAGHGEPAGPGGPGLTEQVEKPGPAQNTPAFCPFCGEELNDSFQWGQYCPYCGEKVEQ